MARAVNSLQRHVRRSIRLSPLLGGVLAAFILAVPAGAAGRVGEKAHPASFLAIAARTKPAPRHPSHIALA